MDPLAATTDSTIDATRGAIRDALPWPFSVIVDALAGDRLAAVKTATRPNPYAAVPSGTQLGLAQAQAKRDALRGGFSGLAGSTERWDHDQDAAPGLAVTGLRQDVSAVTLPPSRFLPYSRQGHPRDLNTVRGYTGPVITPNPYGNAPRWGWATRFSYPSIRAGTLLPPEARTPSPREMAAGFVQSNPSALRLDDPYLTPDDMEDW